MASTDDTLLTEFRAALPSVLRLSELQAQLQERGWEPRTTGLPPPLQAYLDLLPLMLRQGATPGTIAALAKPTADGALWVLLQHFSIRALHQIMVAFYDFAAASPIDPQRISTLLGAPPKSVRQTGEAGTESSWDLAAEGAPLALTINLAFSPAEDRMPGARIVASAQVIAGDEAGERGSV